MDYISVKEAAQKMGVTARTVQYWVKEGRLPGAVRIGGAYAIPANTELSHIRAKTSPKTALPILSVLPLTEGSFERGESEKYIDSIKNTDKRNLALAEHYYYSGQIERSLALTEQYLKHEDRGLLLSAAILYVFSNLALEHPHRTHIGLGIIKNTVTDILDNSTDTKLRAYAVFIATAQAVLLHREIPDIPPLATELRHLPEGIRQFGSYILAYSAYLENNYERSLAIADAVLAYSDKIYPISYTYLLLISCIDLIQLKRTAEAKQRFKYAYDLARPDDFIMHFAENYMQLGGLAEICLKREHPADFNALMDMTESFGSTWRHVHNQQTNNTVTNSLTSTEFTVASLYNKSWTAKEIASHMEMSERMIKYYISNVYDKLDISSREELKKYMPK